MSEGYCSQERILVSRCLPGGVSSHLGQAEKINGRDDYCGLYLLRPLKERDFNGRQRALAAEAMAMVALLIGVGTFRGYGTWRGRFRRKGLSGP
jgi:hypothetical protein